MILGHRWRLLFRFSIVKRPDTEWIYTSKFQQLVAASGKRGQLKLCTRPKDIYDVTLRMHQAILQADVLLTDDQHSALELARSLVAKLPYIQPIPRNTAVVPRKPEVVNRSAYDEALDLSEHLKYKLDYQAYRKQTLNLGSVLQEQRQIKLYNSQQAMKKQIQDYKLKHGHGLILEVDYRNQEEQIGLKGYSEAGLQVTFLHQEAGPCTARVLREAEKQAINYTVLPGPSELITSLALSGFPADRFSMEYYPGEQGRDRLQNLFSNRKQQCLSCAIVDRFDKIQYILRAAAKVYGDTQQAYLRFPDLFVARKSLKQLLQELEAQPLPNSTQAETVGSLVIAPFAMSYNEQQRERLFQIDYTKERMVEDDVGMLKAAKLQQKLDAMRVKEIPEVDPVQTAKYLLGIIPQEKQCTGLVMKLLRVGEYQAKHYVAEAKKLEQDHITTFRLE